MRERGEGDAGDEGEQDEEYRRTTDGRRRKEHGGGCAVALLLQLAATGPATRLGEAQDGRDYDALDPAHARRLRHCR